MGQLADRIAFLTTRYGSDAAAWQPDIAALARLEGSDAKAALERFHDLKRRLALFRRAQLLRELRAFPFAQDVPPEDARGMSLKDVEWDIRDATRALRHARAAAESHEAARAAHASLRRRRAEPPPEPARAAWDALGPVAETMEAHRRRLMREARLDARADEAMRRAARLGLALELADDADDDALDAADATLARAEAVRDAHARAMAPLRAPEVASFRHESKRRLAREADARRDAGDVDGLERVAREAEALRVEAAKLASQAARGRRAGTGPPPRERRPGDPMDPYG